MSIAVSTVGELEDGWVFR